MQRPPKTSAYRRLAGRWTLLVASVFCFGSEARADEEPIRIRYRAAQGCPSQLAFQRLVFSRARRAREARSGEAAREFIVNLESSFRGARGTLSISEAGGSVLSRTIYGKSCEEIADVLSLVTALAIDPKAQLELPIESNVSDRAEPAEQRSSPEPESPPLPKAKPEPTEARPSPRTPALPSDEPPIETAPNWGSFGPPGVQRLFVALGPSVSLAAAPMPAIGASALVGLDQPFSTIALSVEAALTLLQTPEKQVGSASANFGFATLAPRVCMVYPPRATGGLTLCGQAELGVIAGQGAQINRPTTERRFWSTLGGLAGLRVQISDLWFVAFEGGAVAPVTRYQFHFDGPDTPIYSQHAPIGVFTLRLGKAFE